MSVQAIVKMGTAKLLERSQEVTEFNTDELRQIIQDLKDTQEYTQGAGVAAPQIGINLRIIRFGFEHCARYPERQPIPETILINPEFKPLSDEKTTDWEGCLSIPGIRCAVPRYHAIQYWGFDETGQRIEREVTGFHARVIQHEIDHLDGVLTIQRVENKRLMGFEDVLDLDINE